MSFQKTKDLSDINASRWNVISTLILMLRCALESNTYVLIKKEKCMFGIFADSFQPFVVIEF